MAKIKVGINGVGRIGRTLIRQLFTSPSDQIEVTAINNPGEPEIYTHLIKHDSVHSTFTANVNYADKVLYINEQPIRFFTERDPSKIPWSEAGVEIVIDATGKFKNKEDLSFEESKTAFELFLNEIDLVNFLIKNKDAKYATDVLSNEINGIYNNPIKKYFVNHQEQVIITPHIGGMTKEAQNMAFDHAAYLLKKQFMILKED